VPLELIDGRVLVSPLFLFLGHLFTKKHLDKRVQLPLLLVFILDNDLFWLFRLSSHLVEELHLSCQLIIFRDYVLRSSFDCPFNRLLGPLCRLLRCLFYWDLYLLILFDFFLRRKVVLVQVRLWELHSYQSSSLFVLLSFSCVRLFTHVGHLMDVIVLQLKLGSIKLFVLSSRPDFVLPKVAIHLAAGQLTIHNGFWEQIVVQNDLLYLFQHACLRLPLGLGV
jgi:hypothetical protein